MYLVLNTNCEFHHDGITVLSVINIIYSDIAVDSTMLGSTYLMWRISYKNYVDFLFLYFFIFQRFDAVRWMTSGLQKSLTFGDWHWLGLTAEKLVS